MRRNTILAALALAAGGGGYALLPDGDVTDKDVSKAETTAEKVEDGKAKAKTAEAVLAVTTRKEWRYAAPTVCQDNTGVCIEAVQWVVATDAEGKITEELPTTRKDVAFKDFCALVQAKAACDAAGDKCIHAKEYVDCVTVVKAAGLTLPTAESCKENG